MFEYMLFNLPWQVASLIAAGAIEHCERFLGWLKLHLVDRGVRSCCIAYSLVLGGKESARIGCKRHVSLEGLLLKAIAHARCQKREHFVLLI